MILRNPPPDEYPEDQRGDAWEPPPNANGQPKDAPPDPEPRTSEASLPIMSCAELLRTYPERRPPVIEGLLRVGETMNIIAAPKIGKSWLTLGLAFAVATGRPWLGNFQTTQGKVLLIDNELHPETSAHRLRTMARHLSWPMEEIAETISIVNLRGRLQDLYGLGNGLRNVEHGRFRLVIIDAFYRTLPMGTDENDNGRMASLYNKLDSYADAMGAAFSNIHHASKGDQATKAITDVGAGAGAQSRATDTHLILRSHEQPNAVVLDAAVRSWPPVVPLCLRWDFPVWTPAPELDPTALRTAKPRKRKPEGEREPKKPPEPAWTAKRFAEAFGKPEPRVKAVVLEEALQSGLSERRAGNLLKAAVECGNLFSWQENGATKRTLVATVKPPVSGKAPSKAPRKRRRK
jgi:hypothetical protein